MKALLFSNKLRLFTNYSRLFITFFSGFLVVRLLAQIGPSTLTLYLITISGTGFAFFMKVVMEESVVPLLGLSFDSKNDCSFEKSYWICIIFSFIASIFALIIFLLIWTYRNSFDIGSLPMLAFGVAICSSALRTICSAVATPPLNALLVSGHIKSHNTIIALSRVVDLISVAFVLLVLGNQNEAFMANVFFVLSSLLYVMVQLFGVFYASNIDPRFKFSPVRLQKDDLLWSKNIFSWNIAIVIGFLLYLRLSVLLINTTYGEAATIELGLVFLLIGYQRQLSRGLVIGLDAVVSRICGSNSNLDEKRHSLTKVIVDSSYMQSIFSFASLSVLFVMVEIIFRYWLGDKLNSLVWNPDQASLLYRIMAVGVLARAVSENWMKILNGQGLVRTYSPWLLTGGIIYTIIVSMSISSQAPLNIIFFRMAISFSVLYVVEHLIIIPFQLSRHSPMKFFQLLRLGIFPGLFLTSLLSIFFVIQTFLPTLIGLCIWLLVAATIAAIMLSPRLKNIILHNYLFENVS